MTEPPVPQLVAHRGYLCKYPENTWMGLEAALAAGACWLEFDIQMCADGRFVLLHDADFQRTSGRAVSVFDASSHELRELSVHEPQRFANRFAPLRAPFLDEILPRLSVFPACRAMVEIKHESLAHWGVAEIMDRLLDALEPYATGCLLISYRQDALDYARRHTSGLEVGWVLRRYDEAHLKRAETLAPEVLVCNQDKIPEAVTLRAGRWRWMLYDIVDPQLALDWAGRGASLIETADIGAMLRHPALARKGCSHGL